MRRDTSPRRRLRPLALGLLAAGATAGIPAIGASPAVAQTTEWNPQNTNVPYLAWAGEELRLNKCIVDPSVSSESDLSGVSASFLVEDWSGGSTLPQIEPNTVNVYYSSDFDSGFGGVCFEGDAVSLFPGMARIELDVSDPGDALGLSTEESPDPVLKHQFLAGWMTYNTPTLTELSASDFPSSAQAEAAAELGDPTGNGQFNAGADSGYLDVKVTGSIPMDGPWAGLVGESTVTLPTDWALLAHALATDTNPDDITPWTLWETSGDNTGLEGHVTTTPPCKAEPAEFTSLALVPAGDDNVDDCTGGGDDGPFSNVFGGLSGAGTSVGPYDPLDPGDTLLPEGTLSSLDAPMPAARVDISIAPNSGSATDTTGVGYLAPADKAKTYSRDFLGSATDSLPDNEYAPFYDAYIPATSRPSDATSGVDGGISNNFNGFLVDGKYHFWNFANVAGYTVGSATDCLRESSDDDPQTDSNPEDYFQSPSGPSTVSVYTDQHGEAQVQWYPGEGFYFNSLINSGAALLNADGGCDLQSLDGVAGGLGSATIDATAVYPFKPVDYPPVASNTITKDVTSLWSKTLAYFAKGTGSANANSRIVVAHAQNIDGTPFAGEVVCFSANAEGVTWFNGTIDGINLSGTSTANDPKGPSLGRTCVRTDANGNAGVEVLESDPVSVDVIADFTNEGILRDISVDYSSNPTQGGTPPPTPPVETTPPALAPSTVITSTGNTSPGNSGSSGSSGNSGSSNSSSTPSSTTGTTEPSVTVLATVPGTPLKTTKVAVIKSQIRTARLLAPLGAQHYLVIRVTSGAKTVQVRVLLVISGKKQWKTFRIKTNTTVKVAVGRGVSKIKEVLLG